MDIITLLKNKKEKSLYELVIFSGSDNRLKNLRLEFASNLLVMLQAKTNKEYSIGKLSLKYYSSDLDVQTFFDNLNVSTTKNKKLLVYFVDIPLYESTIEKVLESDIFYYDFHDLGLLLDPFNKSLVTIDESRLHKTLGNRAIDESFFSNTILNGYFKEYSKTVSTKESELVRRKILLIYRSLENYDNLSINVIKLISYVFNEFISLDDLIEKIK